jgi:hypothetical protein
MKIICFCHRIQQGREKQQVRKVQKIHKSKFTNQKSQIKNHKSKITSQRSFPI